VNKSSSHSLLSEFWLREFGITIDSNSIEGLEKREKKEIKRERKPCKVVTTKIILN
jgi:hypothetical protein